MARDRSEGNELGVQRLGILPRPGGWALDRPLDHLDVEADLLLECSDLTLRRPPDPLLWMANHRVVNASDEAGNADDPLEVDLHNIEGRRVVAVALAQLERELVCKGRLPGVAWAEQRDVCLSLQGQRDLVRERIHSDDLGSII